MEIWGKDLPTWLIVLLALAIPGAGHVLLGKAPRGLIFIFWMFAFGYITYHLAGVNASPLGKISGGVAIWVLSVLEASRLAVKR